jgi:hypothetical protein
VLQSKAVWTRILLAALALWGVLLVLGDVKRLIDSIWAVL